MLHNAYYTEICVGHVQIQDSDYLQFINIGVTDKVVVHEATEDNVRQATDENTDISFVFIQIFLEFIGS